MFCLSRLWPVDDELPQSLRDGHGSDGAQGLGKLAKAQPSHKQRTHVFAWNAESAIDRGYARAYRSFDHIAPVLISCICLKPTAKSQTMKGILMSSQIPYRNATPVARTEELMNTNSKGTNRW
jgi:hypothetical protein